MHEIGKTLIINQSMLIYMTLTDIDYIESLPNCIEYKDSDWYKLKTELSDYIVTRKDGKLFKPIENMYNFLMRSDISPKMATHNILFTLSSTTRRDQTINYHNGRQHFNIWGIVIGHSSVARKSVTEDRAEELLVAAGVPIIPSNFTASAMFPVLRQYTSGAMVGAEFTRLLKAFQKEHFNELPETLCQVYDCKAEIKKFTRMHGEETIENAYFTFLGSTTPFAYEYFTEDLFVQGYLMRFIYCLETKKVVYKKTRFAPNLIKTDQTAAVTLLTAMLNTDILNVERGDDQNIPLAFTEYQDYCDQIVMRMEEEERSIVFSYYGRTPEFVLKVAGLLELARQSAYGLKTTTVGLGDDSIILAVKIVRMFEQEFRKLVKRVRKVALSSPVKTDRDTLQFVMNQIATHGVISNPELLNVTNYNRNKLRELINTLVESRKINVAQAPSTGGRGAPPILFYPPNNIYGDIDNKKAVIIWLKRNSFQVLAKKVEDGEIEIA